MSQEPSTSVRARVGPWGKIFLRQGGWALGDQGLSSATNFTIGVLVARSVDPRHFGAFGVAFAVYQVALGASRALTSEPLVVKFSGEAPGPLKRAASDATGAALGVGIVIGAMSCLIGLTVHPDVGRALVPLGISLPGLMLQDSWRYAFFATRRGAAAFANDLCNAVALVVLVLLFAREDPTLERFTLAWGMAATVAAAVGFFQSASAPRPFRIMTWFREQRHLASRYFGEFLAFTGGERLTFYSIGVIAGLAALGSFRGAQLLLGPLTALFSGLMLVAVPEAVRMRNSRKRLTHFCATISIGFAVLSTIVGVGAQLLPDSAGEAILGDSWRGSQDVILPFSIAVAALGAAMGSGAGLRGLAAAERGLRTRIRLAVLTAVAGIGATFVGGAEGAAWSLAITGWISALVWWLQFRAAMVDYHERATQGLSAGTSTPSRPA